MMRVRCSSVSPNGKHCRRPPTHILRDEPHLWWSARGTPRPMPERWQVTSQDRTSIQVHAEQDSKIEDAASKLKLPVTDIEVERCIDCPLLCPVTDRCQHPNVGRYGRDVGDSLGERPKWCGLRQSPFTVRAA